MGEGIHLENVREGKGYVSVANGQRERIAEVGSLGPLENVQKVNSFTRTLVSVADLVEQFGIVIFDAEGAHIASNWGDEAIITQVGRSTEDRLYRYDGKALERHIVRLPATFSTTRRSHTLSGLLRSWGCANGATAG